jgi:hypothetical protein
MSCSSTDFLVKDEDVNYSTLIFIKKGGFLIMGYFDNGLLNKYQKS